MTARRHLQLSSHSETLREFRGWLSLQPFQLATIRNYVSDINRFCAWQEEHGVSQPANWKQAHVDAYWLYRQELGTSTNTLRRAGASFRLLREFLQSFSSTPCLWDAPVAHGVTASPSNKGGHLAWKQLLNAFDQALTAQHCKPNTRQDYLSDARQFAEWGGWRALSEILQETEVAKYQAEKIQEGVDPHFLRRQRTSLQQLAKWAEVEGLIPHNPLISGWYKRWQALKQALPPLALFEMRDWTLFDGRSAESELERTQKRQPFSSPLSINGQKSANKIRIESGSKKITHPFVRLYQAYTAQRFSSYLHLALLIIFTVSLALFGWQEFFTSPNRPFAYPSTPTRPSRVLSFQGRLTDSAANPITTSVTFEFRLWSASSGGSELWDTTDAGSCPIDPDQDGVFSTLLGTTTGGCGNEIAESVFSQNQEVWLEVKVGSETLTPRQRIATVGYALNSETLQGFPVTLQGNINNIPLINALGEIIIGANNPSLIASSGAFLIQAESFNIQTESGTQGDINFNPDAGGSVNINSGTTTQDSLFITNTNLTSGNLIRGEVTNNNTSFNLISLAAGSTPDTKFLVDARGNTTIDGYLQAPGATLSATYAGTTLLTFRAHSAQSGNLTEWRDSSNNVLASVNSAGALTLPSNGLTVGTNQLVVSGGNVSMSGDLAVNGGDLTSTGGLNITPTGALLLNPSGTLTLTPGGAMTLGSTSQTALLQGSTTTITSTGGGNDISLTSADDILFDDAQLSAPLALSLSDTALNPGLTQGIVDAINDIYSLAYGGTTLWTITAGSLHPINTTTDLLIGGSSSSSAKFAVLNVSGSGTPTASVAGNLTLASDASQTRTIGATRMNTLQLGDTQTGDLSFAPAGVTRAYLTQSGYLGIGTTTPRAELDVEGNASTSGTLAFRGTTDPKIDILNGENFGIRTSVGGNTGLSERFTILNSGNIGIGDTTPDALFEVLGTTEQLRLSYADGTDARFTVSSGGNLTIDASGTVTNFADNVSVNGGTLTSSGSLNIAPTTTLTLTSTGATTIDSTTDIILDADSGSISLVDGGSTFATLSNSGTDLLISPTGNNVILSDTTTFNVGGNGSNVAYNVIGDSTAGASANVNSDDDLYVEGNVEIDGSLLINGLAFFSFNPGSVLFVGAGGVATENNANFFYDEANTRLGIGNAAPTATLDVAGSASTSGTLTFRGTTDPSINAINGENLDFKTSVGGDAGLTTRATLLNSGQLGLGDTTPDALLEVLGTTEQLRLSYSDGTNDARFTVSSGGNLTIDVTGGTYVALTDDLQVNGGDIGISTDTDLLELANSALTINGTGTFTGTIFANGGAITRTSGALAISNTGSGNVTVTSAGEIVFDDTRTTTIPLSLTDTDLSLFPSGDRAIVDALNYLYANGGAGGSGSYFSKSSDNVVFLTDTSQSLLVGGNSTASAKFAVNGVTGDLIARGYIQAPGATFSASIAGNVPLVVRGHTAQTANLTEWKDGNNNVLVDIDATGNLEVVGGLTVGFVSGTPTTSNIQIGDQAFNIDHATSNTPTINFDASDFHHYDRASNFFAWTINNSEKMRLNSSGYLGIGNNSPRAELDVTGNASISGALTFRGTADPKINILGGESFGIRTSIGGDVGLSEKFTVLNNGRVGIGNALPDTLLEITDSTNNANIMIDGIASGRGALGFNTTLTTTNYALSGTSSNTYINGPSGGALQMAIGGTTYAQIDSSGYMRVGASAPGTSQLTLTAGTTATEGITYGTDTNIYRAAANRLKTDDQFVASTLSIGQDTVTSNFEVDVNGDVRVTGQLRLGQSSSNPTALDSGSLYYNTTSNTIFFHNGTTWVELSGGGGGGGDGGLFSNSDTSVANGEYVEVAHNQATNDLIAQGWVYDASTSAWKDVGTTAESTIISSSSSQIAPGSYIEINHNLGSDAIAWSGWYRDKATGLYTATPIDSSAQPDMGATHSFFSSSSQLPAALSNVQAITHQDTAGNTYLYAIGGQNSGGTRMSTVYRATVDVSGNVGSWSTTGQEQLPAVRTMHRAAYVNIAGNAYVYVIGGNNSGASTTSTVYKAAIDSSGNIGAWATTSQGQLGANNERSGVQVVDVNGTKYIYIVGGSTTSGGAYVSTVYKATIDGSGDIGAWSTTSQGQIGTTWFSGSLVHAEIGGTDYLYAIAGVNGAGTNLSTVYKAAIDSSGNVGTWSTTGQANYTTGSFQYSSGIAAFQATDVSGTRIYTYGGFVHGGANYAGNMYVGQINEYTGDIESWTNLLANFTLAPLAFTGHTTFSVGGRTYGYQLGGLTNAGGFVSTVYKLGLNPTAGFSVVNMSQNTTRLYNYTNIPHDLRLDINTPGFRIEQPTNNAVRLYNYSGSTQNLRLDVVTSINGGTGGNYGGVSLDPLSADVASTSGSGIWVNKTGTGGNILRLQDAGADIFKIADDGDITIGDSTRDDVDVNLFGNITQQEGSNLTAISNITDVFVYDTSTDNDRGDWTNSLLSRGLSWYTETKDDGSSDPCVVSTDDRCGRSAFPSKAILVTAASGFYIFDAQDNTLWMKFTQVGTYALGADTNNNPSSVYARDGRIYVALNGSSSIGLVEIDFKMDRLLRYNTTNRSQGDQTIGTRNSTNAYSTNSNTALALPSNAVNDVHVATINGQSFVALGTDVNMAVINRTEDRVITVSSSDSEDYNAVWITDNGALYGLSENNDQIEKWINIHQQTLSLVNSEPTTVYGVGGAPGFLSSNVVTASSPDALTVDTTNHEVFAAFNNSAVRITESPRTAGNLGVSGTTWSTTGQGQLGTNLGRIAGAVAHISGTQYAYLVGGYTGSARVSTVYKATIDDNGNVGAWATTSQGQLAGLREGVAVTNVVIGGTHYIYAIGGWDGTTYYSTVYKATIDSSGNIGAWSTTSQGQYPATSSHHSVVPININGTQYLYGIGNFNGTAASTVYRATIDSSGNIGSWATTNQTQLPAINGYTWRGVVPHRIGNQNYIYMIGGYNGSFVSTVYRATVDGSGNITSWSTTGQAQLPQVLGQGQGLVISTENSASLYYIGGQTSGSVWLSTVYKADIDSSGNLTNWSTTGQAQLPATRAFGGMLPINHGGAWSVVLAGGSTNSYFSTVYKVDLDSNNGSIKHYRTDIVSEELVGDTRLFLPLNTTYTANTTISNGDRSPYANAMTARGSGTTPTRNGTTSSVRGWGATFDGGDSLCSGTSGTCADDDTLDMAAEQSFSVGLWFKASSGTGTRTLIAKGTDVNTIGYKLYIDSNDYVCFGIDDDTTSFPDDSLCTSSGAMDDDRWHHVVATKFSNSELDLYVDGRLVGTDTGLTATGTLENAGEFYVGVDADGTSNLFTGAIDEVFITASPLTAEEIARIERNGRRAIPHHMFQFDNATTFTSTTIGDSSASWVPNQFVGSVVGIYGGVGADQYRKVVSNTATVLTVSPAFTTVPTATSDFLIESEETGTATNLYRAIEVEPGGTNRSRRLYLGHNDSGDSGGVTVIELDSDRVVDIYSGNSGKTDEVSTSWGTTSGYDDIVGLSIKSDVTAIGSTAQYWHERKARNFTQILDELRNDLFTTSLQISNVSALLSHTGSQSVARGNELVSYQVVRKGWFWILGGADATTYSRTVSFGTSFDDVPVLITSEAGKSTAQPANLSDCTTATSTTPFSTESEAYDVSAANFTLSFVQSGGTAPYFCFTWVAIGTVRNEHPGSAISQFAGADLAEWYATPDESLQAGEIVAINTTGDTTVVRSQTAYDPRAIGIVATQPAITLGWESGLTPGYRDADSRQAAGEQLGKKSVAVALAGRVPLKVTLENGPIAAGDALTSSSTPGYAMKATAPGPIVGRALESFTGDSTLTSITAKTENEARTLLGSLAAVAQTENASQAAQLDAQTGQEVLAKNRDLAQLSNDSGTIMVFVNLSYFDPQTMTNGEDTLTLNADGRLASDSFGSFALDSRGRLTALGSYAFDMVDQARKDRTSQNLAAVDEFGTLNAAASASSSVAGLVGLGTQAANQGALDAALARLTSLGALAVRDLNTATARVLDTLYARAIESESVSTNLAKLDLLTPLSQPNIVVQLGGTASQSGQLIVLNKDGEQVAAIDASGQLRADSVVASQMNARYITAETWTGTTASLSGQLTAESARIQSLSSELADLSSLSANNASISGTLYAGRIAGILSTESIENFEERVKNIVARERAESTPSSPSALLADAQVLNQLTTTLTDPNASSQTEQPETPELDLSPQNLEDTLELGSLALRGSLQVGELILTGSSLNFPTLSAEVANTTFSIQPSGQGTLDLLASTLVISKTGGVTINGNLALTGDLQVAGQVRARSGIFADSLQPADGKNVEVSLASTTQVPGEFIVRGSENREIAAFSASGSARFQKLQLPAGTATASAELNTSLPANTAVGTATLAAGQSRFTIQTNQVSERSLIYLTPTSPTQGRILYVAEKRGDNPSTPENEAAFTVAVEGDAASAWTSTGG